MPRISSFYGITIWMYYDKIQHLGRPHFHVRYGDAEASVDIEKIAVLAGGLPPRAWRLVFEWASLHQGELRQKLGAGAQSSASFPDRATALGATILVMRSVPLLVEATPVRDHTVHLRFEDGLIADVDLSYLAEYGGVFEPVRDPEYFRRLRADPEAGTIVWPNQADIAPETLYAHARRHAVPPAQR